MIFLNSANTNLHKGLDVKFSVGIRFDYTLFRDDTADVAIGSDIKGGIPARHVGRCLGCRNEFGRRSFLDGYALSRFKCNIQRSNGSSHIKGDLVEGRNDGKVVGSNFVRCISIGANTICSNNTSVNFLSLSIEKVMKSFDNLMTLEKGMDCFGLVKLKSIEFFHIFKRILTFLTCIKAPADESQMSCPPGIFSSMISKAVKRDPWL